jgi:hypothetical protein
VHLHVRRGAARLRSLLQPRVLWRYRQSRAEDTLAVDSERPSRWTWDVFADAPAVSEQRSRGRVQRPSLRFV